MAKLLAVVGIEIIIAVVPKKPKRTDNIGFIVVRIPLLLFAVIVEILEAHFAVGLNGNMEVVCILYHAVIHTADTACDERPAVQTGAGIAVCQAQDLCLCYEKTRKNFSKVSSQHNKSVSASATIKASYW